jgi:hypothetical protein
MLQVAAKEMPRDYQFSAHAASDAASQGAHRLWPLKAYSYPSIYVWNTQIVGMFAARARTFSRLPKAAVSKCSEPSAFHSMISSARARSVGGIVISSTGCLKINHQLQFRGRSAGVAVFRRARNGAAPHKSLQGTICAPSR